MSARLAPATVRTLPPGAPLHDDFEVIGVIHDGRFAITYLAQDLITRRRLVIKEYLPATLARRAPDGEQVVVRARHLEDAFKAGMNSFLHEARLLADFDHPALIRAVRVWKDNGTACMELPLIESPTLRRVITERGAPPDEADLRRWLRPLLDALETLHGANGVHGDLSPDSILITPEGPLLLGFGGGRHAIGAATHAPAEVLMPGYAAIEQYALAPTLGPWTDLYALAGVLRALMTGRAPMAADVRRPRDPLPALRDDLAAPFSDSLIDAVEAALAVDPARRPRDVAAFRALLHGQVQRAPALTPAPGPR